MQYMKTLIQTTQSIFHLIRVHQQRIVEVTAVLLALAFIIVFIALSISRVGYPLEVEWMEGAFIRHAERAYLGLPIYVKPSIHFVSFLYQPLYYYAVAAVMPIFGFSCTAGRVVTFVSTILTTIIIFSAVFHLSSRSYLYGLIGGGLFLASYALTDQCFDIVRPDPMFVTLLVASIVTLTLSRSVWSLFVSALLLALAVFTKQQAIYYLAPIILWLYFQHRNRAVVYTFVLLLCLIAGVYILYTINGDWYFYYLYKVPLGKSSGVNYLRLVFVFSSFVFSGWTIAALSTAATYLTYRHLSTNFLTSPKGLLMLVLISSVVHMAVHLADIISGRNSAIPFAAFLSIAFPLAMKDITHCLPIQYRSVPMMLIIFQFAACMYTPKRLPFGFVTEQDNKTAYRYIESVRSLQGDVLLWNNSIATDLAGKRSFANELAIQDVLCVNDTVSRVLAEEVKQAFQYRYFTSIIIDDISYNAIDSIPGYRFSSFVNVGRPALKTYYGSVPSYPRYILVPR